MTKRKKLLRFAAVFFAAALICVGCKKQEQPAESAVAPPPAKSEDNGPAMKEQPKPGEPDPSMAMKAQPKAEESAPGMAMKPKAPAGAAAHDYIKELTTPSKWKEKAPDTYRVKFETTRGDFTVSATRAWSPLGADRFYNLVKHHFYDGAAFFRVVPGFVVQFGISANPAVSAAWKKTEFKDDAVTQSNKKGTIVFATAGPNTRTTQIFINLKDNGRLDGMGFSPFAVVDGSGMNVVEMMYEGYGDSSGPDQDQLEKLGTPYLQKGWPKLDYTKSATLVQ